MTVLAFRNGRILLEDGMAENVRIESGDDRIEAVLSDAGAGAGVEGATGPSIDLAGGWLVPGFVDTQVNGGRDVLFNDCPDVAGIARISAAHARFGTTALLPTLISAPRDIIARALDAVDEAIETGVPGVVGIHVEGPFLNEARRGIHDAGQFRPLEGELIALLTKPRRGAVMVTLAPECNSPEAVRALVEAGVIVSIGHSNATYADVRLAIANGARGVTHLFNAMSPFHHRNPGVTGAVLEDRSLWCGLIVDGAHVHPAAIRVALAARPEDRFMLVTDAMPTVGSERKRFMLNGEEITVRDGVCVNARGTLAGSDLDMATAVRNTVRLGVAPHRAFAMASTNPARFLGIEASHGRIAVGKRADFVWLDADFRPQATWIGGQRVC
ncbi:N-acetylglucosamine-6-phosphate deacetylase [Novosphingobium sp. CF614]|uniref:N-acetylglucosamine-6-phosphate deacetylase n=1 Tax=Novosphingobium sp. CF614 TaxID=1884364 RepID=UPI0008EF027B|nr:N-acetylglucosamine-6-phosphate deacetylase [Novosphingobium sp. CF614]SFF72819.1 N-acetylglucosamine-6-phosphate deacetylase [Novosphingobium sp. CF614]